jgi:hypothetical protein
MRSAALNGPLGLSQGKKTVVWYSSNAALLEGQAVCYNFDYGTATDSDPSRFNRVETPTVLNAQHFAGVAACNYAAVSGGQMIEIFLPGSVCNILVAVSTVLNTGLLTFSVDAATVGQFIYAGLPGEGSAVPAQTTTYVATAQKCLAKLQVGAPSGGVQTVQAVTNAALAGVMIGGTTYIIGADLTTGNATFVLADGTIPGIRKKFEGIAVKFGTNDFVLTVTTGVTDALDDAVLATVTWETADANIGDSVTFEWDGAWMLTGRTKTDPQIA